MFSGAPEVIILGIIFISLFFQVFLLITFFEKKDNKLTKAKKGGPTLFSVCIIVPVWNEERTLRGTLESLLALNYPKDKLEILVIDDGSTDNTLSISKEFEHEPQIKIFSKENGGKHTAVNFGINQTRAELVGCLDADSFVHPDALQEIVTVFQNPDMMAVTPCMIVKSPKTFIQRAQKIEYTVGALLKRIFGDLSAIQVTPGPFSIFRRKVFEDLGLYKKAYNTEDFEIALRMHKHGYKIGNAPRAFVYTTTPATPYTLFRQRLRWVQGNLLNLIDYRELFFRIQYGHLGILILPMAVVYYFIALFISMYSIINLSQWIGEQVGKVGITGITTPDFNFDWFYVNTSTLSLLATLLLIITLTLISFGIRMTRERGSLLELVSFFVVYPILAPFWLWRAGIDLLRGKHNSWR